MSVAYDLCDRPALGSEGLIADRPRRRLAVVPDRVPGAPGSIAPRVDGSEVAVLRRLDDIAPVRLTRRGVVVVTAAVLALAAGLLALAATSAPSAHAGIVRGPSVVTVRPGDTLWSIASRVEPGADPAAEVSRIARLNHIRNADLVPGEHLRLR